MCRCCMTRSPPRRCSNFLILFSYSSSSIPGSSSLPTQTPSTNWPASTVVKKGWAKPAPEEAWSDALRSADREGSPAKVVAETFPEAVVGVPLTARPDRLLPREKHPLAEEKPVVVVRKEKRGNERELRSGNKPGVGDDFSFPFSLVPHPPSSLNGPAGPLAPPKVLAHTYLSRMAAYEDDPLYTEEANPDHSLQHDDDDTMHPNSSIPRPPLSPTMRSSSNNPKKGMASELRLPKFHPLVYESQSHHKGAINIPSSSRSRGPLSPPPQNRRAPTTMQQYHRDVLARTTSTLAGTSSQQTAMEAPRAPNLVPHGSPGPATPLMLEEPQDYMAAGNGEGSPRAAADRYNQEDEER